MVNPTGRNQYGQKEYPSDDTFVAVFARYAAEKNGSGLNADEQRDRLKSELKLDISRAKLFAIRRRLKIPSVRKNTTSPHERAQAVLDIKADDILGNWGVGQTRQRLANKGILIPRDELRTYLHDNFDEEFDRRFIRGRNGIDRVPLNCLGPWHQIHCDGHEKLNAQALEMGPVSIPIYGFKDQFSAFVVSLKVVPDSRNVETICHLFLDLVEENGCIPLQLVMDKGAEIGDMVRAQETLRSRFAPEFSDDKWPPTVQVQSKRNTPIESFWSWQRKGEGFNIKHAILSGKATGLFNPGCQLHIDLFNWIWPPLVQARLDIFREYWNNHRISKQKKKLLPSGTSPRHAWTAPSSARADARPCSIGVEYSAVRQLREGIGGDDGREQALAFVNPVFKANADAALGTLGFPEITLANVWEIFSAVANILSPS
ncbi:hypothetical protein EYR36_010648 [Pleurotus pulmonarius]|nr:hypothetical protein EYR36_010648 [Pleurotus pulmonarius]KAF4590554.1 hypothetical protein EYR38_009856 [Pleurotus pulmonarius]